MEERRNCGDEHPSHHVDMPEGKPDRDVQKVPNKGEIVFPEKGPVNPLKDEATRHMSHRGGLASARAEHY